MTFKRFKRLPLSEGTPEIKEAGYLRWSSSARVLV